MNKKNIFFLLFFLLLNQNHIFCMKIIKTDKNKLSYQIQELRTENENLRAQLEEQTKRIRKLEKQLTEKQKTNDLISTGELILVGGAGAGLGAIVMIGYIIKTITKGM